MSLLEQDTTRKEGVNKLLELEREQELDARNDKEYKVKAIYNSKVYAKEAGGQLPGLYYLVSWKGYTEEESIWEPALTVMHLCKMIRTFHKDYPEKLIATLLPIDSAPPMAKPMDKPLTSTMKRKQRQPVKGLAKQTRKV